MDNVEIPKWLKELPLAPEFRPTDTEFADPIGYISKIEKEASAFGICKVIPPLPKPSKRYVLNNLNKSLFESRELCSHLDFTGISDSSKRVSLGQGNDTEAKAVFTTRQQEVGQAPRKSRVHGYVPQPDALKQVWQSGEVYTLDQFESKSKAFSRSVLGKVKEVTPQVVEALFWKATTEKPIYVEYANDVPGSGFGKPEGLLHYSHARKRQRRRIYSQRHRGRSDCLEEDVNTVRTTSSGVESEVSAWSAYQLVEAGKECAIQPTSFSDGILQPTKQGGPHPSGEVEGTARWKLSNSPWNLQVIARSAGSLTRFMLDDIPGVTSPMVYIGMLFSWFAWHVEDHELHSLNFLHMGSPKTWYAVPGDYAFAFEEVIRRQAYGGDIDNLASLKLLGEKTTLLSPASIIASGIPCCRLVQNPGEFVVTFPRAYHVGFSHGFNCGEAANFGTSQWLTVAKDAAVRRAAMDHLPMLSHQQLLYLLTMSFISRVPRSLYTRVRSSRMRDRLKKERELLVKKAFIEDVLKENNLLNTLLGKESAFRAVLWHPDSLPSCPKESLSQTGIPLDPIVSKKDELSEILNPTNDAGPDRVINQLTSFMETVDDLYLDSDDLSCEFQVDSGTLPCVACGILGYPFMSVVQPLKKAAIENFPDEYLTKTRGAEFLQNPKSYYHHYTTKIPTSATNIDEGWDTSGFLRPRIFCLEHAIQIEKLLRVKGGARMLIICHSDFQKIKANASAIAEEVGTAFNYEEVPLDHASKVELNLIDLAIDSEQPSDCKEDWTSKLGMNLCFSVKARTSYPSKNMRHPIDLDYLLSIIAPGSVISTIKWCSRKSRTKRDSNGGKFLKSHLGNDLKLDEIVHERGGSLEIKKKVLLQYSRRKYRIKSRNCTGPKRVSGCSMQCLPELVDGNCGDIDTSKKETSGAICVHNMEAEFVELCTSSSTRKCAVPHDEVELTGLNRKHVSKVVPTDLTDSQPFAMAVQSNLPLETCLSASGPIFQEKMGVDKKADNSNEDLDTGNCFISPDNGMQDTQKSKIIGDNNMKHENDWIAEGSVFMTISSPEETSSNQDGGDLSISSVSEENKGILVLEKACIHLEFCGDATTRISELQGVSETCKHDCISTCRESTTAVEVDTDMPTPPKQNHKDFPLLVQGEREKKGKTVADVDMISGNRTKRAREVAFSDFVRSPCEGLRPRKKKEYMTHKSKCNVNRVTSQQQKPPVKKMKKSSGSSNSPSSKPMDGNKRYKCNLEGCRMSFVTREELSLHKRYRCHYEECRGKRFRSHKYVVLHQRVHDDERPLKCTWKGCSKTFKWAWARTEHLRLHTGERPYQCKIQGCGLTFRFVSDFSRHRRKTGHYVHSSI